jgi:hypothetical protein
VELEGDLWVELVQILDQKVKVLRKKSIALVKVQWTCYGPQDVTLEHKQKMWEEYPQFFVNFEEIRMQDSILSS